MQALYRPPCESQPLGEFMWILSLGGAMNAHVGYMHGGIAGLLVDQVMGEVAHSFIGGAEKEGAKPGDELFNKAGMPIDGRVALTIESNIRLDAWCGYRTGLVRSQEYWPGWQSAGTEDVGACCAGRRRGRRVH
jgi:hypothetical protein